MEEKRKAERLKEFNEVTTTIISEEKSLSKEKNFYNYSENISVSGAKIRGNILLPAETLLKIDFTLKNLQQKITAIGEVKWVKIIFEDKWYEAGVEFVVTPSETILTIEDHISWKQKSMSLNPFGLLFWN
jgi:23S rRNA-/tRNA-specific pseudouridylate synthase